MRLLVVEDETRMAELIRQVLTEARFAVDVVHDGASAEKWTEAVSYDAVLLDIQLPGRDGWDVCRNLRAADPSIAILMVTARDKVHDTVRGLQLGADDYISKPFAVEELVARVGAVLRRKSGRELVRATLWRPHSGRGREEA